MVDRISGDLPRPFRGMTRLAVLLGALLAIVGCGPSDVGTIDMAKSKAIAAEKGIGPGGGGPPAQAGKPRKAASARPSQPGATPAAPAPR